jgi:hypothetical protein
MKLMGNRFEITVVADDAAWADTVIAAAVAEIQRIEYLLTTFSDTSETYLVNENAGIAPVQVSSETIGLIQRAVRISKITQGAFDITYGSIDKSLWNFDKDMTSLPDRATAIRSVCLINYKNVIIDEAACTVFLKEKGMRIGFGGIGKGYAAEKAKSTKTKTLIFKADNVRDFAWTSSRKFVWDAMPVTIEGKKIMCMSYYAKEAYNLWRPYSTKVVAHTIKSYSKFTIPYPYPVAQSVEASNGMEYPMICFNNGRTEKDGTYSEATKYAMLGVIIHEVGHNFFPMIINSDERQWTWMDEGLNTFVEYLTEELFDNKFPVRRGPAYLITDYMKLSKDDLEPIMSNSENIANFGANAYSKPATGLNILRETIMGRELFDYAFKEYARRWAFKHPEPADFFRTMEDASGEDLDWFWRGWFYGTEACDISLDTVKHSVPDMSAVPRGAEERTIKRSLDRPRVNSYEDISKVRNKEDKKITFATDVDTSLRDFYWRYARGIEKYDSTQYEVKIPATTPETFSDTEKANLENRHAYELTFSNKGGLVMPIIIEWTYKDGTKEVDRIPAQVWRANENKVVKTFIKNKEVESVKLDPYRETADIDESNNTWHGIPAPSKFTVFKQRTAAPRAQQQTGPNPMQKAQEKKGF